MVCSRTPFSISVSRSSFTVCTRSSISALISASGRSQFFGAKRVEGEVVDAELRAGLRHIADGRHALVMPHDPGLTPLLSPAPVPVHDTGHVGRELSPIPEGTLPLLVTELGRFTLGGSVR
jgi:hypothetical protein